MPPRLTPSLRIAEMIVLSLSVGMPQYKTLVERRAIILIGLEALPERGYDLLRALGVLGRDRPTGRPSHMRSIMALMRRHHVHNSGHVLVMFAARIGGLSLVAI